MPLNALKSSSAIGRARCFFVLLALCSIYAIISPTIAASGPAKPGKLKKYLLLSIKKSKPQKSENTAQRKESVSAINAPLPPFSIIVAQRYGRKLKTYAIL